MAASKQIFPWWQTGHYLVDGAGPAAATRFFFRRKQSAVAAYRNDSTQAFINPQPWPIFVDEIRFFSYELETRPGFPSIDLSDFAFKMRHSRYGEIFSEFVMSFAFGYCDPLRTSPKAARRGGKLTLPQPYHLEAEKALSLTLRAPATSDITGFQAGVRGFDPYNLAPVIRTASPVAVAAGGAPTDVALVSDRDKNVKAINVEDITFSIYGGSDTSVRFFWDLEISIEPPDGPRWTDDISTQIALLSDQLQAYYYGRNVVVFTPPSPYIMMPGDQLFIEGMAMEGGVFGENGGQVVAMIMGHQEVPSDYYR